MIQRSLPLFTRHPSDRKMRRVAYCGVWRRKRPILAKARAMRRMMNLPPLAGLNSMRPIAWTS